VLSNEPKMIVVRCP